MTQRATTAVLLLFLWAACGAPAQDGGRGAFGGRLLERLRGQDGGGGTLRERLRQKLLSRRSPHAESFALAGRNVSIWRPAATAAGPFPTVIFSHGFHGSSTQSTFLMEALAGSGYLVFAPDHGDSFRNRAGSGGFSPPEQGFGKPGEWNDTTYRDRADDILALLKGLQADRQWSESIDWSRVALAGHSLGGYTVLGLAGGWPSWKDVRIKAVLAFSPYCSPYVKQKSLSGIAVPVMYQGGTRDLGITPSVRRRGGAYDLTPSPACFVEFEKAGHGAWSDMGKEFHDSIATYSLEFLDRYLKGKRMPGPMERLPQVSELRVK